MSNQPPPAPPAPLQIETGEDGNPVSFIQFTFVRPDSWEFQMTVGPMTSIYQMAIAIAHLKVIADNAINNSIQQSSRQALHKQIMVPGRPI